MKGYQKERASVNGSIEVMDMGPLVELASEGLLALSVQVGLEVLRQMLAVDVTALAGAKGRHNPDRSAYRHGTETTRVVMGGQKVSVKRPRVRSKEGSELQLPTLSVFQNEDPLNRVLLQRLLCGVSTRKYSRTLDESLEDAACVSKSEASRRFAAAMEARMDEFFKRRIEGSFPAMMIDGLELGKMTIIAAMGIDSEGRKRILGLAEGGSENSEVVKALLADMVERGLDASEPRLYILDGGKALHKAVKDTFGKKAVIQRCQVHKKRNVLSYLPESEQANVSLAMTTAYREFEYVKAKASLELLADNLAYRYPKAADSLREGLEETLTAHRLKLPGLLRQTLSSTNAMESANSGCMGIIRRVCNFKNGAMTLRYAAAGFLEAERGFRRIKGYKQIPILQNALARLTESGDWATLESA
ncbi:MAG TPA: IS256 family transposase [Candidatus Limiplasma sp.]|jgi:putative transposase|nr:IS256 family transposase [Candidatus Limiplasma sp.]